MTANPLDALDRRAAPSARKPCPEERDWIAVDDYIAAHLLGEDRALAGALAANAAAGLPAIDLSPPQGRMLELMARMAGARRILEIGTLGGYSAICLARALAEGGRLVTLEIDPHHAEVARGNLKAAGVADKVVVVVGPALDTLAALEAPFDFIFIDADKPSNALYLREALRLSRPGTAILVDNVVREGAMLDPGSGDPSITGTRALFEAIAAEPRLSATAVQTVGVKGWDGFVLALVDA
ncbi:MAG TPA: O-methyltransferase [Allosphingosinicella sp.]|nr:O-methyltransferase [Allosphingosinicella sp.]